jgi:hypothetical protein
VLKARELSELTPKEEIELRVTLEAITSRYIQCSHCTMQFRNHKDGEKLLEATQREKNCTTPADKPKHRLTDSGGDIHFRLCPGNYVSPSALSLLSAHDAFERGQGYVTGGWSEQPAKIQAAFDIIGRWKVEQQRIAHEKASKRSRSGVKNG